MEKPDPKNGLIVCRCEEVTETELDMTTPPETLETFSL